jgi:hypothetical protein
MPYKDSMFRSLFGNEKAALALYNALQGTDYREGDTDIVINTLDGPLRTQHKNDLSFLVNGRLVVLVEHQSSINENMPFRFLYPVQRLMEGSVSDRKDPYRKARLKLPRPQFIVLYNGTADYPEQDTLRLSDAFEEVEGFDDILLELVVKVYNINEGRNAGIVSRCEDLRGYAYYVSRVQYHEAAERKRDPTLDKETIGQIAMWKAMQDCKDKNLLVDFWDKLSPEEVNMWGDEWDLNIALEVEREEAQESERKEIARKALAEGLSIETVQKITGFDDTTIKKLQEKLNSSVGIKKDMNIALEVEREEGYEKGIEKGREDEREEIARNALAKGIPLNIIHDITGLDLETIKNLQEDQNPDII